VRVLGDPTHPPPIGWCDMSYWGIEGLAVWGSYAYVAFWENGLEVIDLSDPANPIRIGSHGTDPGWRSGAH
jgi:hypothetical protein